MLTSLTRKLVGVFILAALVASTGCIEFERAITLNKDLSGKAKFRMTMNMEPLATFAAQMERQSSGKTGPPTDEELQAAVKGMSDGMSKQPMVDPKSGFGALPPGFTLVDATQKLDGLKMTISVTVGFDDIRKLPSLKLADPSPSGSSDTQMQPFEGVEVKDEGQTILITAKLLTTGDTKMMAPKAAPGATVDPAAAQGITDALNEMMGSMGGQDAMKSQFEAMLKDMREIFRIDTTMTVVDTNATRRETGAVVWEQSLESLMNAKTQSSTAPTTMSLRVKK